VGHFIFWCALFAVALALDPIVPKHLRESGFASRFERSMVAAVFRFGGQFWVTFGIALLIYFLHPWRWRGSVLVLLAGIVSGLNGLVKWMVGRYRPFKYPGRAGELLPFSISLFPNGLRPHVAANQCFPSGHAALAFATAAMLSILMPRVGWRVVFYVIASLVAAERVLENAHYPSDVVAGALLGTVGAKLVYRICVWVTR
jgi:membrane-associated phospholipid phosphatase